MENIILKQKQEKNNKKCFIGTSTIAKDVSQKELKIFFYFTKLCEKTNQKKKKIIV